MFPDNYTMYIIWRSPSLNKLTPMIFNGELTHLGSEASINREQLFVNLLVYMESCVEKKV